jgi:hypothetical protein
MSLEKPRVMTPARWAADCRLEMKRQALPSESADDATDSLRATPSEAQRLLKTMGRAKTRIL